MSFLNIIDSILFYVFSEVKKIAIHGIVLLAITDIPNYSKTYGSLYRFDVIDTLPV